MRIAVVGNSSSTLIKFRFSLMKKLSDSHEVFAVAPSFNIAERSLLLEYKIRPIEIPLSRAGLNPVKDINSFLQLTQFFMSFRIEACLNYFIKPVIYAGLAATFAGVPGRIALIEGLGFSFTRSDRPATWKKKLLQAFITFLFNISLPFYHRVLFLNMDDEKQVRDLIKLPFHSEVIGGIGVDLQDFHHPQKTFSSKLNFLFIGRMLKEKGINEFISAARRFSEAAPEHTFTLIGETDENPGSLKKNELVEMIKGSKIEWVGQVSDVKEYLKKADVFVLPSYREGVPLSTQEALAMGLPLITTDVEGCRETILNGVNGILIKSQSVDELTRAFKYLHENKQLLPVFGANSRKLAEEKFDSHIQDSKVFSILTQKY